MWRIYTIMIILIIASLIIKKTEKFVTFGEYNYDVKDRLDKLKDSNKRYRSKEEVLNDILRILNCGKKYDFQVVNLSHTSDTGLYTMLSDKKNAFVSNISYELELKEEEKKGEGENGSGGYKFFYYVIGSISITQTQLPDEKMFFDSNYEKHGDAFGITFT